jgi:hypothetical protein
MFWMCKSKPLSCGDCSRDCIEDPVETLLQTTRLVQCCKQSLQYTLRFIVIDIQLEMITLEFGTGNEIFRSVREIGVETSGGWSFYNSKGRMWENCLALGGVFR